MSIRMSADDWTPREGRPVSVSELASGDLVAWNRKAFRVTAIDEINVANWPDRYATAWDDHGRPDPATWYYRPVYLKGHWEEGDGRRRIKAVGYNSWGYRLPEHYSVCRLCREVPPCKHESDERVMEREMAKMEQLMAIMPGCCHECREPVTHRQQGIRFPGANLIRPDLPDGSALFHARRACRGGAFDYDARWAAAEPGRRKRLSCEGLLCTHHDGAMECSEGAQCPGGEVLHHDREWHRPGYATAQGCWCVSGDLAVRLAEGAEGGAR